MLVFKSRRCDEIVVDDPLMCARPNVLMCCMYTVPKFHFSLQSCFISEPDLYLGHRNISLLPEQLARDFALLKVVLREEAHGAPMIFGPDVATLNRDNYFGK